MDVLKESTEMKYQKKMIQYQKGICAVEGLKTELYWCKDKEQEEKRRKSRHKTNQDVNNDMLQDKR